MPGIHATDGTNNGKHDQRFKIAGLSVVSDAMTGDELPEIQVSPVSEASDAAEQRDLLAAEIIRLATLVRRAASQRFRRMFDLSTLEWLIVVHLAAEPPLSLTKLAHDASLDLQRASLAVTRLVKRQLAFRRKNPLNARETRVELTPRGHAVFNAIIENWLNKEMVAGLSDAEQTAAGQMMQRLI